MGNAERDENHITVMLGVSSVDGKTTVPIQVNPTTGAILVEA